MSNPEEAVRLVRRLAEEVVGLAGELLLADAAVQRVQSRYAIAAIELLSEAETLGILATSGDRDALAALDGITSRLAELRDQARVERNRSDG